MSGQLPEAERVLAACEGATVTHLAAGEVLVREGSPAGGIFVLKSGSLSVLKGDVPVAEIRHPGALVGEMATLLDRPASATVVATTEATLYVAEDATAFLASRPEIALHAARLLAQRLHDATGYLADLKAQYADKGGHFGMIDKVLASLMLSERKEVGARESTTDDPRL